MCRCQTQDLAPPHIPQLLSNHTAQSTPNWLAGLVDQDARVIVEADDAAVLSLVLLLRANDHGMTDVATTDFIGGGDGDSVGFGTEVALLLNDYNDAVSCLQS